MLILSKQGYKRASQGGFNILELMAVLVIAAILATIAAPSFTNSIRDNRVTTAATTLMSVLALARTEAMARGKQVSACGTSKPNDAAPSCDAGWNAGWIIYVDDAAKSVIKSGNTLGSISATGGAQFYFNNKGRSVKSDGTSQPKTDIVIGPDTCKSGVNKRITLGVDTTGRVTYTQGKCT